MDSKNLLFHETFQPEMNYIAKILELAINDYSGDKFHISEITGIPTGKEKGKVEPHIKYCKYMGLIDYAYSNGTYELSATPVGKEVWNQDKYIHEQLTMWLMHYMISRKDKGAPQWVFVDRSLNQGFNSELSSTYVSSSAQKEFGIASADVTKAFGVVKSSYQSGCFSSLNYLDWDAKLKFKEKTEEIEFGYLYAYVLADSWDELFPDKKEITFTDIINTIEFGKIFGLNDEDVDGVLDTLENIGVIKLNRQLYPVTVVRTADKDEILGNIYSLLM